MSNYIELARRLRPLIEKAAQGQEIEDAQNGVELYPVWRDDGRTLVEGTRVRDEGVLYTVLQTHTTQPDWAPSAAPSLFARVLIPDPDVVPEWVQPDSTNPYMAGDRVVHNGDTWRSLVDNNVWEPGIYGWEIE